MIYEFQVNYRHQQHGVAPGVVEPVGDLRTVIIQAEAREDAAAQVAAGGFQVVSVGPGFPVVDWQQRTWELEEAAVFLKCKGSVLNELKNLDILPRARKGRPVFFREELEAVLRDRMEGGLLRRHPDLKARAA